MRAGSGLGTGERVHECVHRGQGGVSRPATICGGWGHTAFGKRTDADVESLTLEAARAALDDAGIGPTDIDEIVI